MKKIKIMLTAITVFAVVGGALAFKTKNTNYYCSTTQATSGCPDFQILVGKSVVDTNSPLFCTSDPAGTCDIQVRIDQD